MDLARQIVSVAFFFAVLFGAAWALRRKGYLSGISRRNEASRDLELMERLPLSPTHSIHLVRAGRRTILLGVHGSGVTLICDFGEKT